MVKNIPKELNSNSNKLLLVYFNLKGQDAGPGSVTEHSVKLNADRYKMFKLKVLQ